MSQLRRTTARGTLINAVFLAGLTTLGLIKGFVVAAFLSRSDYGVWGLLVAAVGTLGWLKQFGVGDRYVQQDESDQELAFQRAFTLELIFSGAFLLVALIAVPVIALAYDRSVLLAPGFAALLVLPAMALQAPLWVLYRRMEFLRQRRLEAIDPVVEFVVTVGLAAAGAGYWSLVAGLLAGNYAAALAAVRASPYPVAIRYDAGTLRSYASFSWPLILAGAGGLVVAQSAVFVGAGTLGLAGVGAIALASSIALYTTQVDQIVSATLYPAICAVRDRTDLLLESFVKSNRLGLMWGVPLGAGIALFAPDLVHHVLGNRWQPAVLLIQMFGLIAAFDQIGYNWDDYYRARAETRPVAVVSLLTTVAFVAVALPLLVTDGLEGFGIGMAIAAAVGVAGRSFYLARLFPALELARHAARAIAPTVPATLVVLLVRVLLGHRPVVEILAYLFVVGLATVRLEGPLLRELAGYLARRPAGVSA